MYRNVYKIIQTPHLHMQSYSKTESLQRRLYITYLYFLTQYHVTTYNKGVREEIVIIGLSETPVYWRPYSNQIRDPQISLETPSFSSETPGFHWRPQAVNLDHSETVWRKGNSQNV